MSAYYDHVVVERALAGQRVNPVEHEQAAIIRALLAAGMSNSLISARLGVSNDKIHAAANGRPNRRAA